MKQFQAESKRLLDLMINSIYTNREIFLRELISNASDAIDKIYYQALTDENMTFNADDYFIKVSLDEKARQITIEDTGIGMTESQMEENLGIIANSGSFKFKKENKLEDDHEIIGQFGVGFYSAFLVASKVEVISKVREESSASKWISTGAEGYTIESSDLNRENGTTIILTLKENTEDENFDEYLETFKIRQIIKKYSDFIRYPIKMDITTSQLKDGSEDEYEDVTEEQIVNSRVPIWKKNKRELTEEDYKNFYQEKRFGFDDPLTHLHLSIDGNVSYNSILYIPKSTPFDFYTPEYKKGLELYSSGVMIMEKCEDLLPDYFGFVKGIVDSEDLSLNISREILQHDRQLKMIAKNIQTKVKNELEKMLKNDREQYLAFYEAFGRSLKYGAYTDFGANKDVLQDLLMFESSFEDKYTTLSEYVNRMPDDQEFIYYATGESKERIKKLPQTEMLLDKDFEILYFTDDIDEFAIKMLTKYQEKEFKSASMASDKTDEAADEKAQEEFKDIFASMSSNLEGKVKTVKASNRLKSHPVFLSSDGDISIEMEKVLNAMPNANAMQADKVLEVNVNHDIFTSLQKAHTSDEEKFNLYTSVLYNQARLIEGLDIEDPVAFASDVCKLMN